jgi:hypothetical protein
MIFPRFRTIAAPTQPESVAISFNPSLLGSLCHALGFAARVRPWGIYPTDYDPSSASSMSLDDRSAMRISILKQSV